MLLEGVFCRSSNESALKLHERWHLSSLLGSQNVFTQGYVTEVVRILCWVQVGIELAELCENLWTLLSATAL